MNHLEYEVARKHEQSAHKTTEVQIVANFLILLTQGEIRCVVLENYRTLLFFTKPDITKTLERTRSYITYYGNTITLNYHTLLYNKIHYQVYQKPNHKHMYSHFSSNHPSHIFPAIIKTETIRYSRLSSTPDDYNFVRKLFSLRLKSLNYPSRLITTNTFPFLSYHGHKRRTKRLKQNNKQQDFTVFYKPRYNKNTRTDKIVQHILRKYHNKRIPKLTKTYCNSTKLHTLLLTNKQLHNKLIFNSYTWKRKYYIYTSY
jgi:hypothetical protein